MGPKGPIFLAVKKFGQVLMESHDIKTAQKGGVICV